MSEFNDSVRRRNRALERSRRAWSEEQEIRAMMQKRDSVPPSSPSGEAAAKVQGGVGGGNGGEN